jgi:hypothetical protein
MKMSFSQIEEARKNPSRFAARSLSGKSQFFSQKNFRAYFFKALREFHRGKSKRQVLLEFDQLCENNLSRQTHFQGRFKHYHQVLANYCDSYASQGCRLIETRKKAGLTLNTHRLSGFVDRFDLLLPIGYRATITQLYDVPWTDDLRWPLIQKGLADELGCSTDQVEVGIFCLETGAYSYNSFSSSEIAEAITEAESVLSAVESRLPP